MMDYSSNETRRFESAFAYAAEGEGGGEVRKEVINVNSDFLQVTR